MKNPGLSNKSTTSIVACGLPGYVWAATTFCYHIDQFMGYKNKHRPETAQYCAITHENPILQVFGHRLCSTLTVTAEGEPHKAERLRTKLEKAHPL